MDFLLAPNSRVYGISDHKIKQARETIIFFLQALYGYISGMLKKIFHLTDFFLKVRVNIETSAWNSSGISNYK